MARRTPGTGYVAHKPRPDGLWPGGVVLPDGKSKRVYGKTREEAEARVASELRKIAEGRPAQTKDALLGAYLDAFLIRRARTGRGLSASTVTRYEELIRLHIVPSLGQRRVASLTVRDLERLYERLAHPPLGTAPLSSSTIHRVHSFLHVALKDAERRGELLRNPCDLTDPPRDAERETAPLAMENVARYLQAAAGDPDEAFLIVAAETGLRYGELIAVRLTDVDLEDAILSVPEKARRVTGAGIVRSRTKTKAGDRRLVLGGWSVAAIRSHLASLQASGRPNPHGLVWPNTAGGYREPQNFYRRTWRPFLKRAGLAETIQFRELTRKVHASIAVLVHVDPVTLRKRMGHTDVSTTLAWYARSIEEADREAARRIDKHLRALAQRKVGRG